MFNIQGLDHINMNVKNLSESITFYRDLFGFEIKEQGETFSALRGRVVKHAIIGKSNRLMLALYEYPDEIVHKKGINHFGITIDDINSDVVKSLKAKGIKIGYGEKIIDYPQSKSLYIEDPSGYEIELTNNFGGGL